MRLTSGTGNFGKEYRDLVAQCTSTLFDLIHRELRFFHTSCHEDGVFRGNLEWEDLAMIARMMRYVEFQFHWNG